MKRFLSRYFPLIPAAIVIACMVFNHSCANTTQAPTGGKRDTIPPVITKIEPRPGTTNVPVHGAKIYIGFNEFVTVKDGKGIYLSPPQEKAPKYKTKGKGILVYFEEDLLPNTTYTLDLTNAIADNNEGNMFPGYTTFFSTGDSVDSMLVTGTVVDCQTLKPVKGATVMLYKNHADSAVFLERPVASIKTDDWGYFALRNIKDTLYRMYAVKDENNNNKYDPDEDRIAFVDSLVRPGRVAVDTLLELKKYDMKDTVNCLARKSDYELKMFREKPSKQMIMKKVRLSDRAAYITFMAPDAQIDSLWFKGFSASKVITEFDSDKDSLLLWLNDQRRMPDTLKLCVNYWKTDTLGVLVPETEEIPLIDENKSKSKRTRPKVEHKDTICPLTLTASPELVEQEGFIIEFSYPPIIGEFDSLIFKSINPRQKETIEKFSINRDLKNLRRYIVRPGIELQQGWDYVFKIPERAFQDINGFWNDSTEVKVTLPTDEELSALHLNVKGVRGRYIVDLLDEARSKVLRTYTIESGVKLDFPYLKEGKYSIRIAEDLNNNGSIDTGILLKHKQPEQVKFLVVKDEDTFNIPARSEIEQDVDFRTLFD